MNVLKRAMSVLTIQVILWVGCVMLASRPSTLDALNLTFGEHVAVDAGSAADTRSYGGSWDLRVVRGRRQAFVGRSKEAWE
jgi:hypothetical protein